MRAKKSKASRSLRAKLRSPGRPPVLHRAERWPFWKAIAQGFSSEDAAGIAGVSQAVGNRWFRQCGGMPPSNLAASAPKPTGRYLSFAEREQIALARARGEGIRAIARQLGRAASTISRDVALDLAEPQLDLVEPGRVGRGEVHMNAGVLAQELLDLLGLVRREVVGDHMDLLALGLVGHDVGKEGNELGRRVTLGCLAEDLASLGVEAAYKDSVPCR